MTIRARVDGGNRLARKLRGIPDAMRVQLRQAIQISGEQVAGEAKRLIQGGTRSGAVVTIGGKAHQRSGPGEPPKTDTGRLVASIFSELDADGLGVDVGTDVKYGALLEHGTQKMAARPWLFRTFEKLKPRIRRRIEKAANQALRKVARGGR